MDWICRFGLRKALAFANIWEEFWNGHLLVTESDHHEVTLYGWQDVKKSLSDGDAGPRGPALQEGGHPGADRQGRGGVVDSAGQAWTGGADSCEVHLQAAVQCGPRQPSSSEWLLHSALSSLWPHCVSSLWPHCVSSLWPHCVFALTPQCLFFLTPLCLFFLTPLCLFFLNPLCLLSNPTVSFLSDPTVSSFRPHCVGQLGRGRCHQLDERAFAVKLPVPPPRRKSLLPDGNRFAATITR